MRKYPWVPGEEAREALCANKPPLTVDDERSSHNRQECHFRDPVELERVSFISNLFQPENATIFVKMAWRPLGPRSSLSC